MEFHAVTKQAWILTTQLRLVLKLKLFCQPPKYRCELPCLTCVYFVVLRIEQCFTCARHVLYHWRTLSHSAVNGEVIKDYEHMGVSFKSKKGYQWCIKCAPGEQGKGPCNFLFDQSTFVAKVYGVRELEGL